MGDNITVTEGTAKAIAADNVSDVYYQRVKLDVGADGVSSAFTGTLGAVTNLAGGTVGILTSGTVKSLQGGTVNNLASGTVEMVKLMHGDHFGSVGTIGSTATGTVHAAVSGSAIYVTDLVISRQTAATVTVGDGTPTVKLLGPLFFAANGGCVCNQVHPIHTTSGSALVYNTGGGTISITAQGYID